MNFIERLVVKKEIDYAMKALKTHWPAVFHIIALALVFLDPSISNYLHHAGQAGATGLVLWAEVMRWLKSPIPGGTQ